MFLIAFLFLVWDAMGGGAGSLFVLLLSVPLVLLLF
jgi:hypothetical protein